MFTDRRTPQKTEMYEEGASDGWLGLYAHARSMGMHPDRLDELINLYRESHPEMFIQCTGKGGFVLEHISPALIKLVKNAPDTSSAPNQWITLHSVATRLGQHPKFLQSTMMVRNARLQNLAGRYKMKSGNIALFIAPKVAQELFDLFGKSKKVPKNEVVQDDETHESAPNGWSTMRNVARMSEVSRDRVEGFVAPYRASNPEYFAYFKDVVGRVREHVSSELTELLSKNLHSAENAPVGWRTSGSLAKELSCSRNVIRRVTELYRMSNPEWFHNYYDRNNRVFEHFSPQLVELVLKIRRNI